MQTNILHALIISLIVFSFGKANAQSNLQDDAIAYVNTITTPNNLNNAFASAEKVRISDFTPNLSTSNAMVNVNSINPITMKVRFFTVNGDLVKEESLNLNSGSNELTIDMNDLTKGIYVVQFYSKEGSAVRKIIKMD